VTRIRSTYSLIRDHKYRSLAASNLFGGFSYGDADAIECNRIRKVLHRSRRLNIRAISNSGTPLGLSANMPLPDCFSPTLLLPQLVLAVLVQGTLEFLARVTSQFPLK
jgi:hypothetical protein